jgi:hypothetical protein
VKRPQRALGYCFYPRRYPNAPGHPRLDIVLRPAPTEQHFDPEWVTLHVLSDRGVPGVFEKLTVRHPWRWPCRRYRLVAGLVTWGDRKGEEVAAFSFGGALAIESEAAYTTCILTSEAPILYVVPRESIATLLAEEVEVLLAEGRAAWIERPEAFQTRLAAVDPLTLYVACLKTLRTRFKCMELDSALCRRFIEFLTDECRRMSKCAPLSWSAGDLAALL